MKIQKILCPIDFSEFNRAANEYACMLAESTGARIIYFHASLPGVPFGSYEYVNVEQDITRDTRQMEKEVKPTSAGIKVSYVVEPGSPATQIIEYANKNDIDLIVMGTHGHTGLRRVLMGSVAETVVRKADCPVLAIKSGAKVLQES